MTQLLDRPIAPGSTLYASESTNWNEAQDAEDFYMSPATTARRPQIVIMIESQRANLRWLADHVQSEINSLLSLGEGWDGHRARTITDDAARSTIRFVFALCDDLSLPPQFFPLPDGGIQFEWHVGGESVEVEIDADGNAHAIVIDSARTIVKDHEITFGDSAVMIEIQSSVRKLSIRVAKSK